MNYSWLEKIGPLPKLVVAGLGYLGLKEYPGKDVNNPIIMDMAKQLNISGIYKNDEVSWCALFISFLCYIVKKPLPFRSYELLRAKSFASWGIEVQFNEMQLGDIVVFERPGGNHVGILIAVTKDGKGNIITLHVLGGNQSNAVTITEIGFNRLIAVRRYYSVAAPASAKQYNISSTGVLSINES